MLKESEIYLAIGQALKMKTAVKPTDSPDTLENWDSLAHLDILSKLDDKLGGKIGEIREFAEAHSAADIVRILSDHKLVSKD